VIPAIQIGIEALNEMADERRDVVAAIAEWRQPDRHDRQRFEQLRLNTSSATASPRVAIGRGEDAGAESLRRHGPAGTVHQLAREPDLQRFRQRVDRPRCTVPTAGANSSASISSRREWRSRC
jgi:hypothetical protein